MIRFPLFHSHRPLLGELDSHLLVLDPEDMPEPDGPFTVRISEILANETPTDHLRLRTQDHDDDEARRARSLAARRRIAQLTRSNSGRCY